MAVADDETDGLTQREHSLEQALLGSILATVPDALIVIDVRGQIVSFSAAAQRMFQYAESDVLGENISMLMPSPDREKHDGYIDHYLKTGERRIIGIGRLTSARRRDGSIFLIELSVGEVQDEGRPLFTGFIRDLTESQQAERRVADLQAELAHASRVTAMGTLASALAHELNQPLTAIANYLEAGRDKIPATEWVRSPGGEGSHHAIDPKNPVIVYSHGFYGNFTREDLAQAAAGRGAGRGEAAAAGGGQGRGRAVRDACHPRPPLGRDRVAGRPDRRPRGRARPRRRSGLSDA